MMGYGFRFPEITLNDPASEMFKHLVDEANEAVTAYRLESATYKDVCMELFDVIQMAETLIRYYGVFTDLDKCYVDVIAKNRRRGYYD